MYEDAVLSPCGVSLFSLIFWSLFNMNPCQISDQHFTEILISEISMTVSSSVNHEGGVSQINEDARGWRECKTAG